MSDFIFSNATSKISMLQSSSTREDYNKVIRLFGKRHPTNGIELNFGPQNLQIKMFMSGNMAKFHKWSIEKEIAVLRSLERVCSEELN